MIACRIVQGINSDQRLAEFGLDQTGLNEVVRRGLAAAAACTDNHPPVLAGILGWGETVCALREHAMPRGWSRRDEGNLPLVVNASRTIAITVATGDEDTGRRDGMPCTKSAKGPRVADAVSANQRQLEMFPIPITLPAEATTDQPTTWLLLIHRDYSARELRAELSRPINMGSDGRVDGWAERIILDSTPFDDVVTVTPDTPNSPEIDVVVKRRA